jgi:hypothetical protein
MTYRPGPHLLLRVHGIPELRDAGVHGSPRPRSDREDPGCSRNACMTRFSKIDAHCDAASQAHAAADGLNLRTGVSVLISNIGHASSPRYDWWCWMPCPTREKHSLQLLHLLDTVQEDRCTILERLMTAARIGSCDDESWHREWMKTAQLSRVRGKFAFAAVDIVPEQANRHRASNYLRTAELLLKPGDARRRATRILRGISRDVFVNSDFWLHS